MRIPEMTVEELSGRLNSDAPPRLIDVREADEWDLCRIERAEWIPLSRWPEAAIEQLQDPEQELVIQCHHGGRSARAAAFLISKGFAKVWNLEGGIEAWSVRVNPAVPRY
jgi:rhodanese-related sulfurtransferase